MSATLTVTAGKQDLGVHFGEQSGDNILTLAYRGPDTGSSLVAVPATAFCTSATGPRCRWCSPASRPTPAPPAWP